MTGIVVNTKLALKGRYKIKKFDANGLCNFEGEWFDNLITNAGLDNIGNPQGYNLGGPYLNSYCCVGTGTTAPSDTDTFLTNYGVASSGILGATSKTYNAGPPSYWAAVWVYTFSAGTATGTWSEIGVGNFYTNTATEPTLFSHALITSGGSLTTITVLSTESLQVTYELDYYINTTTNSYSFTMSSVSYSGNYLRADVTTPPSIDQGCIYNAFGNNTAAIYVYNGTIGSITSSPSGSVAGGPNGSTSSQGTYTSGSYFQSFTVSFSTSQGNVTGGISAFMTTVSAHGNYQFSVTPSIPKTSSYQMSITFNYSWARYP
jgi:hypothetical protein